MSGVGPQSDSFEELAMPLFDQLYNFAHWLTRNREEAEDLVQETYTKALKGFSSFQLGTNFRAWMYRILRNTFLTSRTGLKVTLTVPLDPEENGPDLAVECETPETILFERANRELLQSAIDELPMCGDELVQFYKAIRPCVGFVCMRFLSRQAKGESREVPHPDVIERYLKALIVGSHAYKTNRELAIEVIMRYTRTDDRPVAERLVVARRLARFDSIGS